MPLDPSISLDVIGGGGGQAPSQIPLMAGGGAAASANPLAMLGQFAATSNSLNQLKMFQQTFAARQHAGQIISQSPDIDTAIKSILSGPDASFATPVLSELRTMQQMLTTTQGMQLGQNRDAFQAVVKGTATAGSPGAFDQQLRAQLATLPPDILQRSLPAIQSYRTAMLADLPGDPTAASTEFNKRRLSQLAGAGMGPGELASVLGTADQRNVGNQVVSGVTAPAALGGGFTPANALGVGQPAGYHDVNGVPVPLPGVGAGGGMGAGAVPNGLGGRPVPTAPAPQTTAPQPSGPAVPPLVSWTGRPFQIGTAPSVAPGAGVLGLNVMSDPQKAQNDELVKAYSTEGKTQFDAASNTLGNLNTLDKAYDTLVGSGSKFLAPGTLQDTRLGLSRFANTLAQLTGQDVPFDPAKIGAAEDFNKVAGNLVQQASRQAYGGSHLAAETIHGVTETIPQLSNTYLGGKLLVSGLQASAQRVVDQRNFEQAWMDKNQGSLINADNEFNRQFPAKEYSDKVLGQFGMSEKGFNSAADIGKAVKQGYLTIKQASDIARDQFPDQFH